MVGGFGIYKVETPVIEDDLRVLSADRGIVLYDFVTESNMNAFFKEVL